MLRDDERNGNELDEALSELKEEPYRKFNLAFALMTIVPFLVFFYLLATQLFSFDIIIGNIGLVLIVTFFLAFLGYLRGYAIIRSVLYKVLDYVAKTKKAYKQLHETQDMLIQSEKFKAVGQLASGIAHEVKNPLGVMLQDVAYLEKKYSDNADIIKVVDMMKRNIERADNIVCTLVDFSRASKLNLKLMGIEEVIEGTITLVKHKMEAEQIDFVLDVKEDLPNILIDKVKMEQALLNLFLNAVEAMPKGGKIFIRSYVKEMKEPGAGVGRRENDLFGIGENALVIEIEDTGEGVSENDKPRLFEPFFTTKDVGKGVGLGLSVTRHIIDLHKGMIKVTSDEGKGTRATVTFKINKSLSPNLKDVGDFKKKRILLIDDEKDFLEITRLNLERTEKYEVKTLSVSSDVISVVHDFKPDLIVLDILMPKLDGLSVCEILNNDYLGKDTPIVVLSALDKESDRLSAFKMGVVDYLSKPVEVDDLIVHIDKNLNY
ncbi:response regulator [Candidatus Omnitrophota bacterium]